MASGSRASIIMDDHTVDSENRRAENESTSDQSQHPRNKPAAKASASRKRRNSSSNGSTSNTGKSAVKEKSKGAASSCRECIRTKTKCSRVWPCETCVKKGIAEFCPDKIAGKSKFDGLRERISELEKENATLKDQLREGGTTSGAPPQSIDTIRAQSLASMPGGHQSNSPSSVPSVTAEGTLGRWTHMSTSTANPHNTRYRAHASNSPHSHSSLLAGDPNTARSDPTSAYGTGTDLHNLANVAEDMLDVMDGKAASFVGSGASALYKLEDSNIGDQQLGFEHLFGLGSRDEGANFAVPSISLEAAKYLVDVYFESIDWMYRPVIRSIIEQDLATFYDKSQNSAGMALLPHNLARLLMVFALGTLFSFPIETMGEAELPQFELAKAAAYTYFRKAASYLTQPTQHFLYTHSITTCEVLHLMVSFLFVIGDGRAARLAWPLLGIATRISQGMGMHRDPRRWSFQEQGEVRKRVLVFWELLTYDYLQALNFGRPPSISIAHVDCPSPSEIGENLEPVTPFVMVDDSYCFYCGPEDMAFHAVKYEFAKLFSQVSLLINSPDAMNIESVMRLDRKLRSLESASPSSLKLVLQTGSSAVPRSNSSPQSHMMSLLLHKALLALHQPCFFKALNEGNEPMTTSYAASFNACVYAARKHTDILRSILIAVPRCGYFWWFFLFHAINSAIIQGLILLKAPSCMLAQDVMQDFDASYEILSSMSLRSPLVKRAIPVLWRLRNQIVGRMPLQLGSLIQGYQPPMAAQAAMPPPANVTWPSTVDYSAPYNFEDPNYLSAANITDYPFQALDFPHTGNDPFGHLLEDPANALTGVLQPQHFDPVGFAEMDPILQSFLSWNPERNG